MSIEWLTLLFFFSLLVFLLLGLPLSFVLGGVSVVFLYLTWGPEAFYMVAAQSWGAMNKFTLVAIPLFIFMAMLLERSGTANDLYEMMYLWFGPVNGGLAIGTVVICAIFSAMCGISGAAVVSMGTIALPSMLKRNYDKLMAVGCINSGGGWGILIPPSVIMILYALISGESVGKLFAGGVMPGLLLLVLVSSYIAIRCMIQPHLGPALPAEDRGDWPRKLKALKAVLLPIRHGAEVIKVERPGVGDQSRTWGPPFEGGESSYFLSVNRNKRSVTVNLKTEGGRAAMHRLIQEADIFLTNLPREGQRRSNGVDWETLHALNPGLMHTGMVQKVDVVEGFEQRLAPFKVVLRLWGNPPELPASRAVWLASAETDGRTGLEVKFLTPRRMLGGLLRDFWRRLTRRPAEAIELDIRTVPSVLPGPDAGSSRD